MSRTTNRSLCAVLAIVIPLAAAEAGIGPGFDPTPIEIPAFQKTSPRPVSTTDLLTLRDLHGSRISPDGKWIAYVVGQAVPENDSYRSALFVASTEPGVRSRWLGTVGPPDWQLENQWMTEDPQWSEDNSHIYHRVKDASGIWQVWQWNRIGGMPSQVTNFGHSIRHFSIVPGGSSLIMEVDAAPVGDTKQAHERGVRYDGSFISGTPRSLDEELPLDRTDVARGGHSPETETWIHNLRDGTDRRGTPAEVAMYSATGAEFLSKEEVEHQGIYGAKLSPSGRMLAYERQVSDPTASRFLVSRLFLRTAAGSREIALTPSAYYVDDFWWSVDGRKIYYGEYDGTNPHPYRLRVVAVPRGTPQTLVDSPGFQHDYSVDRTGRFVACTYEDPTTPPVVRFVDLRTGAARTVVDLNPEFANLRPSPAERFNVSDEQGVPFWGHLVLPLDYIPGRRYPLVITTYRDGGWFLRGGTGDEYPIQVFAANGFAVLNFDIGPTENANAEDFESKAKFFSRPVHGIELAIASLSSRGLIDPSRVGVTGLSHGAELVSYAISHTRIFHAAVASGPGWDPIGYYLTTDLMRAYILKQFGLDWPDGRSRARWEQLSPALNADHVATPLLINGADDEYTSAMQWLIGLRENKRPVEYFIYPNELHIKNQPRDRLEIYNRNVDWLRFWLQDYEDPDAVKAGQYNRWRYLRELRDSLSTSGK